ncbi:MAG: hypothetical protein AAGN15_17195 [Cyanobacteria bacterium J06581_3]
MSKAEEMEKTEQQQPVTAAESQAIYHSQNTDTEEPYSAFCKIVSAHPEAFSVVLTYNPQDNDEKALLGTSSSSAVFQPINLSMDDSEEPSQTLLNELSKLSSDIKTIDARIKERQAVTQQLTEDTHQILSELAETIATL